MTDILIRAGSFVAIIILGWFLRRIGVFKKEDFHLLSKIVMRITLPAALVCSFAGRELEYSMLLLSVMGLAFGLLLIGVAWLLNRRQGREAQAFAMVNMAGFNIGNFVLPFAQGFLGPVAVMAVRVFDVGNSFICQHREKRRRRLLPPAHCALSVSLRALHHLDVHAAAGAAAPLPAQPCAGVCRHYQRGQRVSLHADGGRGL